MLIYLFSPTFYHSIQCVTLLCCGFVAADVEKSIFHSLRPFPFRFRHRKWSHSSVASICCRARRAGAAFFARSDEATTSIHSSSPSPEEKFPGPLGGVCVRGSGSSPEKPQIHEAKLKPIRISVTSHRRLRRKSPFDLPTFVIDLGSSGIRRALAEIRSLAQELLSRAQANNATRGPSRSATDDSSGRRSA